MTIPVLFAKLAGLNKTFTSLLEDPKNRYYNPVVLEYFERYALVRDGLRIELPELYSDLPTREISKITGRSDSIERRHLERIACDIEYIFEVRAHSNIGEAAVEEEQTRVFISHGRSSDWRAVQAYIEKDLKADTLELAQEPNKGRTVLQKLDEESDKCSFAVVVMTGDDDVDASAPRARENVMHEIGFFQGKLGLANVCLLYEEGTNIPSNVHGLVYIPFPKGLVSATFGDLARELRAVFPEIN